MNELPSFPSPAFLQVIPSQEMVVESPPTNRSLEEAQTLQESKKDDFLPTGEVPAESLQQIKKKKKRKKKRSSQAKTQDLSRIYFDAKAIKRDIQGNVLCTEIYRIPFSLLPDSVVTHLLQQGTGKLDQGDPHENPHQRRLRWKKETSYPTYEVTSLAPPTAEGRKAIDFMKTFKFKFSDFIQDVLPKEQLLLGGTRMISDSRQSAYTTTVRFENPSSQRSHVANAISPTMLDGFVEFEHNAKLRGELLNQLVRECKKYALIPDELIDQAFNLLSFCYILDSKISDDLKIMLMKKIFINWYEVEWQLFNFSKVGSMPEKWADACQCLDTAVKKLSFFITFLDSLKGTHKEEKHFNQLFHQLQALIIPLRNWLHYGLTLKTERGKAEFFKNCVELQLPISQSYLYPIDPEKWPCLFPDWVYERSVWLDFLFSYYIKEEKLSEKMRVLALLNAQSLQEKDWMHATLCCGNIINNLLALPVSAEVENKEEFLLKALRTVSEGCQESTFWKLKALKLCTTQMQNVEKFLSMITESSCINQQALQDLHLACQLLNEKLDKGPKEQFNPLKKWIDELKNSSYSELAVAFEALSSLWKSLFKRRQILLDIERRSQLSTILQQHVQSKDYTQFRRTYVDTLEDLVQFRQDLYVHLEKMNRYISKVQDLAFLMCTDLNAPPIDFKTLRTQFELLNQRLCNQIEPIVYYLNAIRQLMYTSKHLPSEIEEDQKVIILRAFGMKNLRFYLFQTNLGQFEKFENQLKKLKEEPSQLNLPSHVEYELDFQEEIPLPDVQVETEIVSMGMQQKEKSEIDELTCKIKEAFLPRSTRRIMRNLKELLKEYEDKGYYTLEWGKGDHRKLYINGVPITLPMHDEWKPKTAGSIRSAITEQLKRLI